MPVDGDAEYMTSLIEKSTGYLRKKSIDRKMAHNNPVITISTQSCADPFVTYAHGFFYMTYTVGNHVQIWRSKTLINMQDNCERFKIWQPPPNRPYSSDVWAPELHALHGRWYVYVACANSVDGNKSHRMYVLTGPPCDHDPCEGEFKDGKRGEWHITGPDHVVRGMPDSWAIDATILHHFGTEGRDYIVWSGWPLSEGDKKRYKGKNVQQLFIARLGDPITVDSPPTMISTPDHDWEWSGDAGINEGPQSLTSPDGRWMGIVYSAAGSWTRDYKMATIQYLGGDPLDAKNWRKAREPLLYSKDAPPFGPGHGSFVQMPEEEGGECLGIFHGTDNATDGWGNRRARCQRVSWGPEGPHMGGCVGPLTDDVRVFRGEKVRNGSEDQGEGGGGGGRSRGNSLMGEEGSKRRKMFGMIKEKLG